MDGYSHRSSGDPCEQGEKDRVDELAGQLVRIEKLDEDDFPVSRKSHGEEVYLLKSEWRPCVSETKWGFL